MGVSTIAVVAEADDDDDGKTAADTSINEDYSAVVSTTVDTTARAVSLSFN
jgi:hypothetical protein